MFDELSSRLQSIISAAQGNAALTEENMAEALREIRRALLDADVSLSVVKSFILKIKEEAAGQDVLKSVKPSEMLVKIVHDELVKLLGSEVSPLNLSKTPAMIMMLGLQGSGKTTSSAKLALKLKRLNKKPLLVAADVYRPAAILQLETLAKQSEVDFFKIEDSKDVQKIVRGALDFARENGNGALIIDTAGRLHIDNEMMAELLLLERSFEIDEKLLVIDSMTGQEAINVAKNFDEQLGITGVILTKLDGDTRGGCALSVVYSTGKHIKFVGMGEKIEPLEDFYPERMASRILGMGDIVSLVQKAQENFDINEAKKIEEKMAKNRFSFDDFLKLQRQVKALGSIEGILSMLPIPGLKKEDREVIGHQGEKHLKKIEVMINSMTQEERENPDILNGSRKARIAKGAGVPLQEFNQFIAQFEQMRKLMGGMANMKKGAKGGAMPNLSGLMGKGGGPNLPF